MLLVRLDPEHFSTELIVSSHAGYAESGCFEDSLVVVVKETREEGQVAWKAVGAVWGDEASDEVTERRLLVRWVQDLDSKSTRWCARNRVIFLRNWLVAEHLALVLLGAGRL